MIYFFFTLVFLPLILDKNKNKTASLKFSFFILFFLAAFQYKCSNDWPGYVEYFRMVGQNKLIPCEPIYVFLLRIMQPIGFFGWLAICAAFNIGYYYHLVKKYVPPKYYLVTLFVYTLWMRYFVLLTNCNRQTLSVTLIMMAIEFATSAQDLKSSTVLKSMINKNMTIRFTHYHYYILSVIFFLIAINIHTSAIVSLAYFPVIILCKMNIFDRKKWLLLVILLIIFISRQVADLSNYSLVLKNFFISNNSRFWTYTSQIQNNGMFTFYLELMYFSIFILIGFTYSKLDLFSRVASMGFVIAVFIQPLVTDDLVRIMTFFEILFPILAAILISKISPNYKYIKVYYIMLLLAYSINNWRMASNSILYHKWVDNLQFTLLQPWQ